MSSNKVSQRLEFEAKIMRKELPQFHLYTSSKGHFFEGWQTAGKRKALYQLKLVLPKYYPDQMPELFVTSPVILLGYKFEKTINSLGTTHAFHTVFNGPGGCVQICHFSSDAWDASKSCVGVLIKGILWLEAYETYLDTGVCIADTLNAWRSGMKKNKT